jgi:hypothetical protein
MQISSIKVINNQPKATFKAMPAKALAKEANIILENPKSKEIFTKLAGIAGLTGIISWATSLAKRNTPAENEHLDVISNAVTEKANSYLLDTETIGKYLDITSAADTVEAELWTKAKANINSGKEEIIGNSTNFGISQDFLDEISNTKLDSILKQTKAISASDKSEELINTLDKKLTDLASKAYELRNSENSSNLFAKLAEIAKAQAIISLMNNDAEKITNDDTIEVIKEPVADETTTGDKVANITAIDIDTGIEKKDIPQVTIVDKIEIIDDGRKRFRPVEAVVEEKAPTKEIAITEQNKDFVQKVFLRAFTRNATIKPEVYADVIDFIQKIYYSYPEEKSLRQNLLKRLKHENNLKVLEKYYEYTKGEPAKVDFINFMDLERLKRRNCGSLTQEDFDTLMEYKDNIIKYYKISEVDEKISLTFLEDVPVEDRLEAITEFHRIAFNLSENNLFNAVTTDLISADDVKDELIRKLSENSEDYANIVDYIGLDVTDIGFEVKKGEREEARSLTAELLEEPSLQKSISALADILNNTAFKDFIGNTHGRMRFLERVVFKDKRNFGKSTYELKKATFKEIEKLKKAIESAQYLDVYNYPAIKDVGRHENRFSPQINLHGTTIALNDKAQIHTIY